MAWVLLEAFYRAKYAYFYRRFEYLIGRYKPGCIAIFNGNRLPEQAVKNIAAKLLVPWCILKMAFYPTLQRLT